MRYMILIYGNEANWANATEEDGRKEIAEYMAYTEELAKAGVLVGGSSLQPTHTATTVRLQKGKPATTDGPFAETKEQLGGYYILDCPDLDAALKWAEKCPAVKAGSVEVRPLGPDGAEPPAETPKPGAVCWQEIYTPDPAAAAKFYGGLFGWSVKDFDLGGTAYPMLGHGGKDFGGLMATTAPQFQGVPPHWLTYIAVEDVDASAAAAAKAGGTVTVPPMDIPVGRMAILSDPHGAAFAVFKSKGM